MSNNRSGVSILEVMFAILIATIGLLGAIAIFPVASSLARKGKVADMSSVAGISAVHDFDTRGMRNPNDWLYYDTGSNAYAAVPLSEGIPAAGEAFFIDPGFVAATPASAARSYFPYYDLSAATSVDPASDRRMNRITLRAFPGTANTTAMSGLQAETVFAVADDLSYIRPEDRSKAAEQAYVRDKNGVQELRRETEGMLTWAATLAPKVDYVGGTVFPTDMYVLSVLVFDQRSTGLGVDTAATLDNGQNAVNAERLVDVVEFGDAGIGGGEVLLQARPGRNAGDLELSEGDWLMLSGYKEEPPVPPATEPNRIGPLFLWYQVTGLDGEVDTTVTPNQRYVTLRGPDWPAVKMAGTQCTQATIIGGVTAVYEKTIRLDTSSY